MNEYLVLINSVIILSFFIKGRNREVILEKGCIKINSITIKNSFILSIIIFSISLFSGLRYGIGTDYNFTYVRIFNNILNKNFDGSWGEIGFKVLVFLVTLFTKNSVWLFIICAFITTYLVFLSIYDYSNSFLTSACLFFGTEFFFVSLNNTRQCLAFSICLYALRYLKKGENKKYIIAILVASSFHLSSILCLPLFLVNGISKQMYKLFAVLPIICIVLKPVLNRFLPWIISRTYYSYYYTKQIYLNATTNMMNQVFNYSLLVLFILCIYFSSEKIDRYHSIFLLLQSVTCCLYMFDGIIPGTYRLIRVFSYFQIISIPNIINLIGNKYIKRVVLIGCAVIAFVICYKEIFIAGLEEVVPYVSIFD